MNYLALFLWISKYRLIVPRNITTETLLVHGFSIFANSLYLYLTFDTWYLRAQERIKFWKTSPCKKIKPTFYPHWTTSLRTSHRRIFKAHLSNASLSFKAVSRSLRPWTLPAFANPDVTANVSLFNILLNGAEDQASFHKAVAFTLANT